jgi:hypothetical protein
MPTPYQEFRAKLDAVLRQRDPAALRAFLVAEGQWDADATTDPERALWLMVATSPALSEMKAEALRWLTDHGYTAEVNALRGRSPSEAKAAVSKRRGPRQSAPNGTGRREGAKGPRG